MFENMFDQNESVWHTWRTVRRTVRTIQYDSNLINMTFEDVKYLSDGIFIQFGMKMEISFGRFWVGHNLADLVCCEINNEDHLN